MAFLANDRYLETIEGPVSLMSVALVEIVAYRGQVAVFTQMATSRPL